MKRLTDTPELRSATRSARRFIRLVELDVPDCIIHNECIILSKRLINVMASIVATYNKASTDMYADYSETTEECDP